jgi:hypothetical protein
MQRASNPREYECGRRASANTGSPVTTFPAEARRSSSTAGWTVAGSTLQDFEASEACFRNRSSSLFVFGSTEAGGGADPSESLRVRGAASFENGWMTLPSIVPPKVLPSAEITDILWIPENAGPNWISAVF